MWSLNRFRRPNRVNKENTHKRAGKGIFFLSDVGTPSLEVRVLLIVAEATAVRKQLTDGLELGCDNEKHSLSLGRILPKRDRSRALFHTGRAIIVESQQHFQIG